MPLERNEVGHVVFVPEGGVMGLVRNEVGDVFFVPEGSAGEDGEDGAPGTVWRSGSGAPSNAVGIDGDFYLRTSNGDVYTRAGGTYSVTGNIKGVAGADGAAGAAGAAGQNYTGWAIPPFTSSADNGGFATYASVILLKETITVDKLLGSFQNETIGNIYNMFIATISSSGDITGTVATCNNPFTTVATGLQSRVFTFAAPVQLVAGTRYAICLVLKNQTSSTSARATGANTNGYANLPLDIGVMVGDAFSAASGARTWYVNNSDAPTSVSKSGSNTGMYGIGLHVSG